MVIIKTGKVEEFIQDREGCLTVCFGAGKHFENVMFRLRDDKIYEFIDYVVDNNDALEGTKKTFRDKIYPVITYNQMCHMAQKNRLLILITSYKYINEIIEQLDEEPVFDGTIVYVGDFLVIPIVEYPSFTVPIGDSQKIPKIINYCWFGKSQFPEEYKTYIESWKKFCPDYELRLWTEDNYDIKKNSFMKEAYENKIWAFVSDYARVDIIHEYGGIYLDCDVELLKPLDDMLGNELFCGFEDYKYINLGLGYGAIAKHPYLGALLDYYDRLDLYDKDGKINLTACPYHQTEVAKSFGLVAENKYQRFNNMTVFPSEVFAPFSYWGIGQVTDKTYSIHHFAASWHKQGRESFIEWKKRVRILYERILKQQR